MSTEQKKPADYTMRDGTPWWKFETMMPPSMDAPILLMNHESGAITPHKDGRYLYDEKDLWTPMPPEAPKDAPSADRKGKTLEEFCDVPPGSFAEYLKKQNAAGGPEAYAMSSTPSPVAGLPTPETDAAIAKGYTFTKIDSIESYVPADFARSLERRLAAARAEVEQWRDKFGAKDGETPDRCRLIWQVALDEQDDLLAQLATAKEALDLHKAAAGFCDKHKPTGGHRNCLACGCERLTSALSEIASECEGNPEITAYDCHYDEAYVVGQVKALRSDLAKANAAAEAERLELGRVHGDVGLFAKKHLGISDNLPTAETFERMAREIHRIRETSSARLDSCIESDDLLHRMWKAYGNPDSEIGREVKNYMDMNEWPDDERIAWHRRKLAQLAAQQSVPVPPEARAVEAAEEIAEMFTGVNLTCSEDDGRRALREGSLAIIQRTCFPPGEGEEWAIRAAREYLAPAETPEGLTPSEADVLQLAAVFLKHFPARPTAARECGAGEAVRNAAEACEELHGTSMPKAMRIAARTGILMRYLGVSEDTARVSLLEWLGESAFFPDWDDNGFWHAKVNGQRVTGTTLRQFCDAAIAARNQGGKTP